MNRIDLAFENLRKINRKALIPFIACGDPNLDETVENILKLEEAGADIIEVGVPFSDPLADGPIIQSSYCRALKNGTKVKDVFTCGERVREKSEVPLVIMVYFNLVHSRGIERFFEEAKEAGFDGIIIPDIPLEERKEIKEKCENKGIYLIPLVAPTSKDRTKKIIEGSNGFVYCVSSNGTTGERSKLNEEVNDYLKTIKESTNIPICLGFGISSREVIREVKGSCDGVIVGSAIVRRLNENREKSFDFVKDLKEEL